MRLHNRQGSTYSFELCWEDYTKVGEGEEAALPSCDMCGKPAEWMLNVTEEYFCSRHASTNNMIYLPSGHPLCIQADMKMKTRTKRPKKLTEQQRGREVNKELEELTRAQKHVEHDEILALCAKWDVDFFRWRRRYRNLGPAKRLPLGTTLEDLAEPSMTREELERRVKTRKQTTSKTWDEINDEYLYQSAEAQVCEEGLLPEEVAEELGIDLKVLQLRLQERSKQ